MKHKADGHLYIHPITPTFQFRMAVMEDGRTMWFCDVHFLQGKSDHFYTATLKEALMEMAKTSLEMSAEMSRWLQFGRN